MNFKIDRSKAINTLLYIIETLNKKEVVSDIHKVMKLMYFADREHLVNYGFPITGDTYQKFKYGPVPSFSNYVANDNMEDYKGIVARIDNVLKTLQAPNMDDLSESEVECIDHAIETFSNYNFAELTKISHDHAWESSDWDIPYYKMAEEGGADDDMKAFIKEQILNDNISFS